MNKHEIRTIQQEAQRFTKGITVVEMGDGVVKLELPYINVKKQAMYFFIVKHKGQKRFLLTIPVESTGLVTLNSTLSMLQPLLKTYGLLLTQEANIIENSEIPLNQRFRNMAQAIIGIDGIKRLWKTEYERREYNGPESEKTKSTSNDTNDSPSG